MVAKQTPSKKKIKSELATVMFVDIVGYSKKSGELSREEFSQMHDAFDMISNAIFEKYDGSVVHKVGDAYLTTFQSATDAILAGAELQVRFKEYNQNHRYNPIIIRVAIHTGDILRRKKDIYGDAVNTTARIEAITKPTDIILSEATFRANNSNTIPFKFIGTKKLKGIKYPVKLFQVKKPYEPILGLEDTTTTKFKFKKILKNTIIDGAIILLIIACLGALAGLIWYLL